MIAAIHAGMPRAIVAVRHGVSEYAIDQALDRWRWWSPADVVPPKERMCLGCRLMFWSDGPGNRMCAGCKHRAKEQGGEALVYPLRGKG